MENTLKHIITNGDLITHPEFFADDAMAGQEVVLSYEDLAILGLQVHTITDEDLQNNPDWKNKGLVEGDQIEIPLPVDEEGIDVDEDISDNE
jgi:hypothetical protein